MKMFVPLIWERHAPFSVECVGRERDLLPEGFVRVLERGLDNTVKFMYEELSAAKRGTWED